MYIYAAVPHPPSTRRVQFKSNIMVISHRGHIYLLDLHNKKLVKQVASEYLIKCDIIQHVAPDQTQFQANHNHMGAPYVLVV